MATAAQTPNGMDGDTQVPVAAASASLNPAGNGVTEVPPAQAQTQGQVRQPGAANVGPGIDKQQERILRLQQQAREYEEVERQRHEQRLAQAERRKKRDEERAAAHKAELESSARKMFWIGCLACPLVFLLQIAYYWKEFRDKNANPVIRTWCKRAVAVWTAYMVLWITWYVVFLVYRNDKLAVMNIVLYKNDFTPIKF